MRLWNFSDAWRVLRREGQVWVPPRLEARSRTPKPYREIITKALLIMFGGILLLAVTLALEATHEVMHPGELVPATFVEQLFTPRLYIHILSETAFAIIIAGVVAGAIEAGSQSKQQRFVEETVEIVGSAVLDGVYRVRHEKDYVKGVINNFLAIRLIRRKTQITYTLSEFSQNERQKHGIKGANLLKVEAQFSYTSENISARGDVFEAFYAIPVRQNELGEFARATLLRVGHDTYDEAQLKSMLIKVGEKGYSNAEKTYRFPLPVNPGEGKGTEVFIQSQFVKERSDNELFTFLMPSIGAIIEFVFNVPGLTIGASGRLAIDLPSTREITPGQHVRWEIDGPCLPFNTVTVWWQTREDSGVSTSPSEASGVHVILEQPTGTGGAPEAEATPTEPPSKGDPALGTSAKKGGFLWLPDWARALADRRRA